MHHQILRLARSRHLKPDVGTPTHWVSLSSAGNARRRLVQVARVVTGLDTSAFEFSADVGREFLPWIDRLDVREIPWL
eukprot:1060465-Pleurochrysis_carterae.AAC.1